MILKVDRLDAPVFAKLKMKLQLLLYIVHYKPNKNVIAQNRELFKLKQFIYFYNSLLVLDSILYYIFGNHRGLHKFKVKVKQKYGHEQQVANRKKHFEV